jgi:hypothetical protein
VIGRIPEENAGNGAGREFVLGRGRGVGIAQAAKDPEMIVVWRDTEKEFMWCAGRARAARPPVEKVGGSGQGFSLEPDGHGGMKEKCANTFIKCAERGLGFVVLLAGVRAREPEVSAVIGKEATQGGIVKLAPIVCLQSKDRALKLCLHIREEIVQERCRHQICDARERSRCSD